jgi:hypothetical protein
MESLTLHDEIERAIRLYEQMTGCAATRTRQMIERLGEVGALSNLMMSPDLQQGFKVLRDRKQLELSFESIVVRHPELFNDDAVQAAQWRLENPHNLL